MVNFRYHLVTITAIFLALAAGVALGVTVGNTAGTQLESRLRTVQAETRAIDATNRGLRDELDTWARFGENASAGLLAGRLADVPVLLVGVRGVDSEVAKDVRETLTRSDAAFLGTIWLTAKLNLERSEDVSELAAILGLPALPAAQIRSVTMSRLARQLAAPERPRVAATTTVPTVPGGATTTSAAPAASTTSTALARAAGTTLLAGLVSAGFVDLDDPAGASLDPQTILPETTRFVVLSGDGADVADDLGAIPLVAGLVEASATPRTVAVEPGRPARDKVPEIRSVFIGPLRASSDAIDDAVSTVNDIEDFRGLAATVLALADLGLGRVGSYGVGAGADRLVPEAG